MSPGRLSVEVVVFRKLYAKRLSVEMVVYMKVSLGRWSLGNCIQGICLLE